MVAQSHFICTDISFSTLKWQNSRQEKLCMQNLQKYLIQAVSYGRGIQTIKKNSADLDKAMLSESMLFAKLAICVFGSLSIKCFFFFF